MTREEKEKWKSSRQAKARNLLAVRPLLRHFPKNYSEDIRRFVDDQVLLNSRYIFIGDKEHRDIGYCTHCRQELNLPGKPKHNADMICPSCHSACQVKHDWRGHSKLIDKAYIHYYEKSQTDPEAIICRGIFAYRDYHGNFKDIETVFETHTYYVFKIGNTAMFTSYKNYWYGMNRHGNCYDIRKSIYPRYVKYYHMKNIVLDISIDSIRDAVKNTPFQYSQWEMYYEHYNLADGFVKYFDLYAKYPCIEYIAKLGLGHLIESRIQGYPTLGALNLRGKTLPEVLRIRLTKPEIRKLKENVKNIDVNALKLWQLSKKDGSNLSLDDIIRLDFPVERMGRVAKYASVRKIIWYIERQRRCRKSNQGINSSYYILSDWADYISDCEKLEFDLTEDCILYPRNLHQAHQNTIKQIKIQGNALLDRQITKRLPTLNQRFYWEDEQFLIRPATTSVELINEGKALHHCVGTYGDRYAVGKTNILFIRRRNAPDKPFYTMEINNQNAIVQCRGLKNCGMIDKVQKFVDEFKSIKLEKGKGVKSA